MRSLQQVKVGKRPSGLVRKDGIVTAPLTPPECDLQDFPFMPLHVARLRDSDLAAECDPEACWYAVLLWAASWHQLPAGSLPDNETVLTRLCGLGRDVKTFRKHRAEAMRGFIKCDDGRLYHPVVAEQVLEGWDRKLQQRWRAECARVKKQNQRHGTEVLAPSWEEFVFGTKRECPEGRVEVSPGTGTQSPSGQALQETETGTETGTISPEGRPSGVSPPKAARLSSEWQPSEIDRAYAVAKGFNPSAIAIAAERFRNFWTAKSGKDAAKLDWSATWRNWILNDLERRSPTEGRKAVGFV